MREPVHYWVAGVVAVEKPEAPVLEIGSRNVNGTVRPLFPVPYLGVDQAPGLGVDAVVDASHWDFMRVWPADWESPRTVVMVETLEHVRKPWLVLRNLRWALQPGGLLVTTGVFDFHIHDYPSDYWRMTPEGIQALLEDAGFEEISVTKEGGPEWDPVGVFATARKPDDR